MKNKEKDPNQKWWPLIVLLFFVLLVFVASWAFIKYHYWGTADPYNARGTFGDQFGAVNALFSGFAFAGMIYALFLQMKEIGYQREELIDNRAEMKRQTTEFQQQNASLKRQRFENTFFNMVGLQQQILNDLSTTVIRNVSLRDGAGSSNKHYEALNYEIKGREYLDYLYDSEKIQSFKKTIQQGGIQEYAESRNRSLLDHYFRHFYTILKYIEGSEDIEAKDKYQYATILRATLSRNELNLLYYNGLTPLGKDKLKPLLEKYCMLNNLDYNLLSLSKENIDLYGHGDCTAAKENLKKLGLSGTDFELYLTDNPAEKDKYLLSAFYHDPTEMVRCQELMQHIHLLNEKYLPISQ